MTRPTLLLILLILLTASIPSSGAVLDVSPDGSGQYPDLEHALAAVQPGDSIRLADGVYTGAGNRNLLLAGDLTIFSAGSNPEQCVLDLEADGRGFLIYTFPGTQIEIKGIGFRNGDPGMLPPDLLGGQGGAIAVRGMGEGGAAHVLNCLFEENRAEAGGGAFLHACRAEFRDCVFRSNTATDGAGAYCGACDAGDGVEFRGSLFAGNQYPYPSVGGYGAGVYFSHSAGSVEGCTFSANRAWLGAGLLVSTASDVEVANCLITHSTEGQALAVNAGTVAVTCSDLFGNAGGDWIGPIAGSLGQDGNISEDPLYCDLDSGDYTLRGDSPCLPENNDCGLMGALAQGCHPAAGPDPSLEASGRGGASAYLHFPNPCLGRPDITLRILEPGRFRLRLLDITGRLQATLIDECLEAGDQRRFVDAASGRLPAGLYFLSLEGPAGSVTRRLCVLR